MPLWHNTDAPLTKIGAPLNFSSIVRNVQICHAVVSSPAAVSVGRLCGDTETGRFVLRLRDQQSWSTVMRIDYSGLESLTLQHISKVGYLITSWSSRYCTLPASTNPSINHVLFQATRNRQRVKTGTRKNRKLRLSLHRYIPAKYCTTRLLHLAHM